jgi:hypothetical protein
MNLRLENGQKKMAGGMRVATDKRKMKKRRKKASAWGQDMK